MEYFLVYFEQLSLWYLIIEVAAKELACFTSTKTTKLSPIFDTPFLKR